MDMKDDWFLPYEGVEKYQIHPTESIEGRLQFNENLWGPSPKCMEVLKTITPADLNYYDLKKEDFLVTALSSLLNIPSDCIFLSMGSSEVIKAILSVTINKGDYVLIPKPGWGCYRGMINAKLANIKEYNIVARGREYFHDIDDLNQKARECNPKVIIITTPQMPTGNRISQNSLEMAIQFNPSSIIIIDECYYGCAEMNLDVYALLHKYKNIVFVRTLSKIYGLANLRVGYGIANTQLIELFDYVLPLHKLPNIVRKIAKAAIEDTEYTEKNKKEIIQIRTWLTEQLNQRRGVTAYTSYANFVYVKIDGYDTKIIHTYMSNYGIHTRLFEENDGTYMRITVAPKNIMKKMLDLLDMGMEVAKKTSK